MKKLFFTIFFLTLFLFVFKINVFASNYSEEEVSSHNTPSDCWMIFEEKVYDISDDRLEYHDRYMDIRDWCGKDMTQDFKDKAGMDRDHKASSYSLLENYYIGDLINSSSDENSDTEEQITLEADHYSIEISGSELKNMTVKEVADLWRIDPEELLESIIKEFDLKEEYSISSIIDEMRTEGGFSPSEIKEIAEKLLTKVEVEDDEKESVVNTSKSKNPYNLLIPVFLTTVFYYIHYYLTKVSSLKKHKIFSRMIFNAIWNSILILTLIPSAGFGIFMILRYSFKSLYNIDFEFMYWHVEGSLVMATSAILHLITRLKMYFAQVKNLK